MKTQRNTQTGRPGFTLLELLIVVVIISIIAGMLLPAIQSVLRSADAAAVKAELSQLETAITKFKSEYGVNPPSYIEISETAAGWNSQSRSTLRRIFPQFSFGDYDFDGNGSVSGPHVLTSSECLVFFIGGMPNGKSLTGFSKNPLNPFSLTGENRTPSLYEFKAERLVDSDGDGLWEYLDQFETEQPLLYASNVGQGYETTPGRPSYYLETLDGPAPSPPSPPSSPGTAGQAWKKDSYQLISAGVDGEFGFDPIQQAYDTATGRPPRPLFPRPTPAVPPALPDDVIAWQQEQDNVTNFTTGTTMGD